MNHNVLNLSQNVHEIQIEHARETLLLYPRVYHKKDIYVSRLNPRKNPSKNFQHIPPYSILLAPRTMDNLTMLVGRIEEKETLVLVNHIRNY
jgi:hypothetical protein